MERSLAYSSGISAEFEIPTLGSISAVSRVRSLILTEERLFRGDE